jgi:hypothetical protein
MSGTYWTEMDCNRALVERDRARGLLQDLVTAKRLNLDAEEWQLVWDRVFAEMEKWHSKRL